MIIPLYARISIIVITLLSVFWLPWPVTCVALILSEIAFPPAALGIGILADILYYPGSGFYWGTATGAVISLMTYVMRHFVKTRIM